MSQIKLLAAKRTPPYRILPTIKNKLLYQTVIAHLSNRSTSTSKHNKAKLAWIGDNTWNFLVRETLLKKFPNETIAKLAKIQDTLISRKYHAELAKEQLSQLVVNHCKENLRENINVLGEMFECYIGALECEIGKKNTRKICKVLINEDNRHLFDIYWIFDGL
ncbi:3503_t:CDS:2 [Ambispora gerdemannii]|uniref:3503_t:CDS:1 n=1 Tax=Ambispora gerdemannii TaxID=144530 RepID=A0A9N8ZLS6_9GLOM|nr:3503_t:CDS:2 [Ambispora gerdemannii]